MRYVKDLTEGENVSEIYLCKIKQNLLTKAGKTYYSLVLQDKTGTLDGKIWELSNAIDHFESMNYIQVEGQVTLFNHSPQLNIRRVRVAREGEYNPEDYLPCSKQNRKEMYAQLMEYVDSIKESHLKALLEHFFVEDKEFSAEFARHSAAKSVHHGFLGGLLEHTLGVTQICDFICKKEPMVNRDLLLCAGMLHDIGKVQELSDFPTNDYTECGNLLGHIYMGTAMIEEQMKAIPGFPPLLALELKHCILAHHGELEYGSPKKPALMEAMALNLADNMDAKIESMKEFLDGGDEKEEWLGYNRMFESNIRRTGI